jgi:hypothetical protein
LGNWIGDDRERTLARQERDQQFQPLRAGRSSEQAHPGHVSPRPVEVGDEAELDRVGAVGEYDGDACGRRLRGKRRRYATGRCDHSDSMANKIGGKRGQPIQLILGETVFDRDVGRKTITMRPGL